MTPTEARWTATFVESVVLPTPPLAEKTVTIFPVSFADPAGVTEEARGQLAAAPQGLAECRLVVGGDDLTDAGTQRGAERRDVDPAAEQDDAELGPVETGRLGELAGLLEGDLRADDDLLDTEVVVEDAGDHRRRVEGLGVRAEDEAEALERVR